MKNLTLSFLLILGVQGVALAGDPVAGKQKAETCIACHGDASTPAKEGVPKINRMTPETFKAVMAKMREAHHDMPIIAHTLSDQDVEDIAAHWTFSR